MGTKFSNLLVSSSITNEPIDDIKQQQKLTTNDALTCHCISVEDIFDDCPVVNRMIATLKEFDECSVLRTQQFGDIYSLTQIKNDFDHIKEHINSSQNSRFIFRARFKRQFQCIHRKLSKYKRTRNYHCFNFTNNTEENIVYNEFCKIYSYLTYSEEDTINTEHISRKEDRKWFDYPMTKQHSKPEHYQNIYSFLVEQMGCFQRQLSHGISSKQYQGLIHLRPKYENIKEEMLCNPYYCLSKDNWNQTLRKSTVFYNSFARHRIKARSEGRYDDTITQQIFKWKKGETIGMQEIVIFKLYTDFDKLQHELKKCFRFNKNAAESVYELEERLRIFYWWRVKLLTVLSKYSSLIDPKVRLYHGVNAKMVINNEPKLGFCGPLSTSLSYNVARTFASAKGMVLEMTTQFPKLGLCKAFDVSLISDYPEEREQLVSFAYLRITKVFTKPLHKHWRTFDDMDNALSNHKYNVSLPSQTKSIFFAVHLFLQQIFSMSLNSEYWLAAFIYLGCGYDELNDNKDKAYIKRTQFVNMLQNIVFKDNKVFEDIDMDRYTEILNVLYDKFNSFRKCPNQRQIVKIDKISKNLTPYFMDFAGLDIYKKDKFDISFDKITKIFENAKQIHFLHSYVMDDRVLSNLVLYLMNNPNNTLKTIKFMHYDCETISIQKAKLLDLNTRHQHLIQKLRNIKWEIKCKSVTKTGYEITLECITSRADRDQTQLCSASPE